MKIFVNFSFLLVVAISASAKDLTKLTQTSTVSSTQGTPTTEAETPNNEEYAQKCHASNIITKTTPVLIENEPDEVNRYVGMAMDDLTQIHDYSNLLNFEVRIKNLNLTLAYTPERFIDELTSLELDLYVRCGEFGTGVLEKSKQFQRSFAAMYMSVSHLMDKHLPRETDPCPEHIEHRLECLQLFGKTEKEMMKWLQEDTNSENSNLISVPHPVFKGTKGANKLYKNIYDETKRKWTTYWMQHNSIAKVDTSGLNKTEEEHSRYIKNLNWHRNYQFGKQNSYSLSIVKDALIFEPDLIITFMAAYIKTYMKVSYALENYLRNKDPLGGDLNHTLAQRCNFLEFFRMASNETMIWALEQREDGAEDYYTFDIHEKREQDKKIIQDHLFNMMDAFLQNSSGSNFCRELTPLGIFTDDKSDFTFDIYGRKCIKPCTDYGKYWYCYYSDSDWHYCSPKGKTKKGETCKSKCTQGQNTSYYWCSTDSSWNTCTPYL